MRALVLAAGLGERLRPLTDTTPKPLLEVGGRPLIHYPLALLRSARIREVAINVHHLAGQLEAALGTGKELGLKITWSPEPALRGTGGPLNALRDFLSGDTFVIANSDSILDIDLKAMLKLHRSRAALATIALARPDNLDYYSHIEIDADSRIRRMRLLKARNPLAYNDFPDSIDDATASAWQALMYCGLIIAEPSVLTRLPEREAWSLMSGLFGPMVAQGLPVLGYAHHGYFRTVDDVPSYQRLRDELAARATKFSFFDHHARDFS